MDEFASSCHQAVCQLLVILLNLYYRICPGYKFIRKHVVRTEECKPHFRKLENYEMLKVLHVVSRSREGMTWT